MDTCFANPGTSEMHFVAALDRIPGMRCVLGLFEGVVTGAADGYARMADKPAATLLHCGPGLANGLANLHNARRARVPMVNIVGDQATFHRPLDAPLTADTEGWARAGVRLDAHRGARGGGGGGRGAGGAGGADRARPDRDADPAVRHQLGRGRRGGRVPAAAAAGAGRPGTVDAVARVLRSGEPAMLIMSGRALRAGPLAVAGGICAATGARMMAQTSNTRIERGAGRMPIERVPYPVDAALQALAGLRHIVLVGAVAPVGFFAYPGKPGRLYPEDCTVHVLARPDQDGPAALAALADALGARPAAAPPAARGSGRAAR